MSVEAMKQAVDDLVEALQSAGFSTVKCCDRIEIVIADLRQAIAEAEKQDPVAWNGWVLREVYFEDGIPCTHREPPKREPSSGERLELIGHADLTIDNIHIFNGYGEDVPDGRVPIYAGCKKENT